MERLSTPQQVFEQDGDIILRTAEPTDGQLISDYFIANRAHLKQWEPRREDAFFSESGWTQRLIKLNELHRMGLGYYLIIIDRESGEMLGTVSFSNISRFPFHACNLGYSLGENAQGRGVMTRALKMAVNYMFSIQNIHRIMAGYMPRNQRSEAVLNRLGFKQEGFAEDYLLIDGRWEDHNLTSLINPNWKES
ncbi:MULTISPECIES: ribosomal protein S5-alanine N-acetyltransferase [Vibrio]|uniref:ribosomal protein S5-alanine N-acetyltransferase n=1 Tax=Vibrio TaxID=662 RepID=UPI0001B947BC|nr:MULTISPECIES: ribosomal protein S5-alanine N-acetyltransferase [Vibrio]EEX33544.1 ribosomal-protein-alanine acetyltransferase [Vibrio coralliilyticus ATCC BAA-450]MCM5509633.1 ribosomal protein S5-alanine N-acetyltransferase [Vibrio sp. SCSIO 43169]MDE3895956.1 ribosomal protein S5-alanine N-acetyltransferase [Vibrio sp. CC007]NRF61341.1 ribosomal protein S5-alanine N-acetyltransferase [Vibrio coralliilyticus]QFT36108.1 Putative ribosomal N-acetyltransferase YdaF [Vibrio sp. THAF64]